MKFKLVPVDNPYTDPTTGIKVTHKAPDLLNPVCPDCQGKGWLEVAYGKAKGIYDVYRFPCKCQTASGKERQDLIWSQNYTGRPVAYTCHESEIPGHVLIHPIHAQEKMTKLRQHLRRRAEELDKDIDEDLPF